MSGCTLKHHQQQSIQAKPLKQSTANISTITYSPSISNPISKMQTFTAVSALLLAAAASAQNTAYVLNNCTFDIAFASMGGNNPSTTQTLAPAGVYSAPISGAGASLQARTTQNGDDNELDYSLTSSLFYALGGNNGFAAFQQYGLSIVPSDETCQSIICPPGDANCPIGQTFSCPTTSNSNLNFTLCI